MEGPRTNVTTEACRRVQTLLRAFTAVLQQLFDEHRARALLQSAQAPLLQPFLADSGYANGRNAVVGADEPKLCALLCEHDRALRDAVATIIAAQRATTTEQALEARLARREAVLTRALVLERSAASRRLEAALEGAHEVCGSAKHAAQHRVQTEPLVAYGHRVASTVSAPWLSDELVRRTEELALPPMVLNETRNVPPYPVLLARSVLYSHSCLVPAADQPKPEPAPAAEAAAEDQQQEQKQPEEAQQEQQQHFSLFAGGLAGMMAQSQTTAAATREESENFDDW